MSIMNTLAIILCIINAIVEVIITKEISNKALLWIILANVIMN